MQLASPCELLLVVVTFGEEGLMGNAEDDGSGVGGRAWRRPRATNDRVAQMISLTKNYTTLRPYLN